ncbi:metallophosphoesterase family protein [Methylobacterium isbiliense]|uniref:3',5'-cyclic adenosine monophosphate phosphodiesterase CpdA n=1 Tax=Methylobacterium isbiliense TaxID=315478 RepID=A0ABQ4SAW9_9HYPH|nr:metallophosphoesterase [Methylobacterium isbiliense]MDN3622967.1 metallophosphoesterase [Methylobacterium isbiliense]GJE00300.1 3',5'-cyclic adenosine monophosphate phosphodiesterase CpdA [Methylobacterium isbiliense]
MRRIAHISDLHFRRVDPAVVEGLLAELDHDRPDLVIASGDFTMRARTREYEEARAFLARVTAPVLAVPGNHDISPYRLWQRFFTPFRRYRRYIAPETEPVFQDEEIAVIGLNTVRTWAPERDWSQGKITRAQIRRTERVLAALPPHLFRIIVGHHPFIPPPWDAEARLVGRADEALAAFQRHHVGLALAGHLHRGYSRFVMPTPSGAARAEIDRSEAQTTATRLLAVQAGSATSTRLRGNEPNAYNRITVEGGVATVQVRLWTGSGWCDAAAAGSARCASDEADVTGPPAPP